MRCRLQRSIRRHLDESDLSLGRTLTIEITEAIKYAIVENMGITILSVYILGDAVGPDLTQLRARDFPVMSDWYVVHPRAKQLSLIAERFLEFVLRRGPHVLPMENLERQVRRALAQS